MTSVARDTLARAHNQVSFAEGSDDAYAGNGPVKILGCADAEAHRRKKHGLSGTERDHLSKDVNDGAQDAIRFVITFSNHSWVSARAAGRC